jgi:imidazolonepropionase
MHTFPSNTAYLGDHPSHHLSADGVWHNIKQDPHFPLITHADYPDHQPAVMSLVVQNKQLVWSGPSHLLPAQFAQLPHYDCQYKIVTPGLVDCHTHLVYGGNRANEFAMRLEGASYEAIAKAGGGIISTVNATRQATEDELLAQSAPRLEALLAEGVCALEIKSGYGLSLADERKQLKVARRLAAIYDVKIQTTFLGAHAVPPEYTGRADDYIEYICQEMLPTLALEGLVDAVDVFCENIAFNLAQTEKVFKTAQALGLPVKLHAEQLSDMDGSALAAQYQALSCDHIEHLSLKGIAAMKASGTVAVLLPGAFYNLRDTHVPPIQALRDAGVPMAVSTDHNPGTSPVLSLLLMTHMACTFFRLTVAEALAGITYHAAKALALDQSYGGFHLQQAANFVIWPCSSAGELVYNFGQKPACTIIRQGKIAQDSLHITPAFLPLKNQ